MSNFEGIHWKEEEKLDYSTQSLGFKTFATNPQEQSVSFRDTQGIAVQYKVGDTVGNSYKLLEQIGQGGMGVVYLASHLMFEQQYALKILAPNQITESNWSRFEIEGRSLAKINHQNIVKIFNMGIDDGGCPFYVMELLKGEALIDIMEKDLLAQRQVLAIYSQACAGLASAHRNGIVHRDVKPSNIMICGDLKEKDSVKIVDFGIASMSQGSQSNTEKDRQQQSITQVGEVFGSPFYMSPEQCSGEKVDVRSDIYSLGCSMYHTLTGKPPFIGKTAMDTLMQHVTRPAPLLADGNDRRDYSPSLEQLVSRLLHKNPNRRYQSMEQVMHDIDRIAAGKAIAVSGQLAGTLSDGTSMDIRSLSNLQGAENNQDNDPENDQDGEDQHRMLTRLFKFGAIASVIIIGASMVFMMSQPAPIPAVIKKTELNNLEKEKDEVRDETKKYAFTEALERPVKAVKKYGKKMRKITFPTDISIGDICKEEDPKSVETAKNVVLMPADTDLRLSINRDIEVFPPYLAVLNTEQIVNVEVKNVDKGLAEVFHELAQFPHLRTLRLEDITISKDSLTALHSFSHLDLLAVKECTGEELDLKGTTLLKRLRKINFTGYNLKLALVEEICSAPNIFNIGISESEYPPDLFEMLAKKPTLTALSISSDNLEDKDLEQLSKSKSLVYLEVKGRNFKRGAVERLADIKTLKHLIVHSTIIWDREQVKNLNARMPVGSHPIDLRPVDGLNNSDASDLFGTD